MWVVCDLKTVVNDGFFRDLTRVNQLVIFPSMITRLLLGVGFAGVCLAEPVLPVVDSTAAGFREMVEADFVNVNGADDTWKWEDGVLHCSGEPLGVLRTKREFTNFELMLEWKHLKPAGNSGVFVWTTPASIRKLEESGEPGLPDAVEVQILDPAFTERFAESGRRTDWFTTDGDVFAVRVKLSPFPPLSPDGSRSFPSESRTNGHGEWNHYYIRAINGEIRLWVNGGEVSGGNEADPATGFLCLQSEGSPILFRNIRIRELP